MSRYIDADKLIELCEIMVDKCDGLGKSIWKQFAATVEWSPYVDAVPVVRCKNCGFFEVNHFDKVAELDNMPLITAHNICRRWGNGCQTSPDGFCFMGIRKKVNE